MSSLNIYRLSGLEDEVAERAQFWTAGSNTLTNTRAANYILSEINLLLAELQYSDVVTAELYNKIDLSVVCLAALRVANKEPEALRKAGYVIQSMINDNLFENTSVDEDDRCRNLDELETLFDTYYFNGAETTNGAFVDWWEQNIINNNYNNAPGAAERFEQYQRENIGSPSLDPKDYKDLADYVDNAGVYFLYYFMSADELKKSSLTVKRRYRKEEEVFRYVYTQCQDVYDEKTVYNMLYAGCAKHYDAKPEKILAKLKGNEKVGDIFSICAAIIAVVTTLSMLLSLIKDIFTFFVQTPDDPECGIPRDEDWNISGARPLDNNAGKNSKWILIAGAVAALLMIKNKK